jgi:non-ribosomal peptide synthetase component F/thioesterase domain-containing protein/acyl carrier protein
MEHQAYPFEKVVEEIQIDSCRSGLTWLQAYFIFQKAFMLPQEMADLTLKPLRSVSPGAMFEWMMGVLERTEGIRLQLEYNTDLFDESTIERVLHQFQYLLETIVIGRDLRIDELPILTPQERQQLVSDWNETRLTSPTGRFVHTMFEEQVIRTPDAPAFQKAKTQTCYAEVNLRVNQLAYFLQGQGLQLRSYVGLALEQDSIDFVVSFLAVLKAGGCCIALDLPNDAALVARLVTSSQLRLLVTQKKSAASLEPMDKLQIIDLDKEVNLIGNQPEHNPSSPLTDKDPAYVSFTGRSRNGAVITHSALSHGVSVARRELELTSQDFVAFSLTEMLPALLSGAKLVFRTSVEKFNAIDWCQWAGSQGVTVASLPTTSWHDLVHFIQQAEAEALCKLRLMAIGGSQISPPALLAWEQIAAGRIRLVDRFLLAEAAGAVAFTEPMMTGSPLGRVSIVRPAPNTRIYLLDDHLHPVPIGVPGSLFVCGDHLASDYILSAETPDREFVANPIYGKAGSRLIRTGDAGRFLPSGGIELLGRIDDLAKTNGFRSEFSEIRSTLFQHPAVWDVLFVVCEISGKSGLVAYWINHGNTPVQPEELRAFLTERLPAYMVPDVFVPSLLWPMTFDGGIDYKCLALLTPKGKIDREALPALDLNHPSLRPGFEEPRNLTEAKLVSIWRDILRSENIGISDNFFGLGGNSLTAVRLVNEINKQLKVNLSIPEFFKSSTIEQIARIIQTESHKYREPRLISLKQGNLASFVVFLDAGVGLCRLAEQLEGGPAIYATTVPFSEKVIEAAELKNTAELPSLEELSLSHASLIQNQLPAGSIVLVGHSFGGLLAFEVAHQLQRAGRKIDMLFLLDTWAVSPPQWAKSPPWSAKQWSAKFKALTIKHAIESLTFRANRFLERLMPSIARRRNQMQPVGTDANQPITEVPWEVLLVIHQRARMGYQLKPLKTKAVLFRACDSPLARHFNKLGSFGWSAGIFTEGLEILDCPGDHLTLLKSPNLVVLASHFQRYIQSLAVISPASEKRG